MPNGASLPLPPANGSRAGSLAARARELARSLALILSNTASRKPLSTRGRIVAPVRLLTHALITLALAAIVAGPAVAAERVEIWRLVMDDTSAGSAGQVGTVAVTRAYSDVQIALDCVGVDAAFQIGFPVWTDARESAVACAEGAPSVVVHTSLPVGNHAVNGAISWSSGSWAWYVENGAGPDADTGLTLVISGTPGS